MNGDLLFFLRLNLVEKHVTFTCTGYTGQIILYMGLCGVIVDRYGA